MATYRFKSSAFPFTAVEKVAATLDWSADVSNKPTIGTSTLTAEQVDTQLSGTHGSGAWGSTSTGTGARLVTITVQTTGSVAIEGAYVRAQQAGVTKAQGPTNSSGVIVLALDDGTYDVTITKADFYIAPQTLTVAGNTSPAAYQMAAMTITPPTVAGQCTGVAYVYDENGALAPSTDVLCQLVRHPSGTGTITSETERTETSSGAGLVQFTGLWRGASYEFWVDGSTKRFKVTIDPDAVADDGGYALPNFRG